MNGKTLAVSTPLPFQPIFMERIWGGRRLESEYGKQLPPNVRIGESWEIVDRPEAQSVVRDGSLRGKTLHELWTQHHDEIFGEALKTGHEARALPERFPLLIKILDAQEKLSLQVHPPGDVAERLGGEAKTEFWYVAAAEPNAELYVGLRKEISRAQFEDAVRKGATEQHVHTIPVKAGDAMFLPSGRFHAIGGGNLLIEIQQNSDTTYRVFDWNRVDDSGKPRELHVEQALDCINFEDVAPGLVEPKGEILVRHGLFEIQKWSLDQSREIVPAGQFAIVCCLTGKLRCADADLVPGEFFLVPASLEERQIQPMAAETTLLRVTIPM